MKHFRVRSIESNVVDYAVIYGYVFKADVADTVYTFGLGMFNGSWIIAELSTGVTVASANTAKEVCNDFLNLLLDESIAKALDYSFGTYYPYYGICNPV